MTERRKRLAICAVVAGGFALAGALSQHAAVVAARSAGSALEWPLRILLLGVVAVVGALLCRVLASPSERLARLVRDLAQTVEQNAENEAQSAIDGLEHSIASLRQEKRRAETVLSNIADGIIAVDRECAVTLFNRAAELVFGRKASDVVGRTLEDADLHPEITRMAAECLSGGGKLVSEIRLPGPSERAVAIRAMPFEGVDGECAMVILRDVSEVRRHEKSQREFVSNVSHELKTPITSVRVTAEALLNGAKNDEQLVGRFLNNIVAESDRLSALIEDLLDIARRDSGIARVQESDANVAAMLDRAAAPVRPQAEVNGVEIIIEAPDGLLFRCDELQIEQMVRNLVDNAVKYTPPGGRVNVRAFSGDGGLVISVADTGIGIPQGEVHRIFDRFYRVDKARSRRLGGTGLGLSIVKDIVESHAGEIAVESQLGKGSIFTVTLPAKPLAREVDAPEDSGQGA